MKTKPSGAIQQTITLLEQEIEALEQRRGELLDVIESLRPLAGEASPQRGQRKTRKERTSPTPKRGRPRRSVAADVGEAIVKHLKAHGPTAPGALAKALGMSRPELRYQIKPLEKAKRVVSTGSTMNRLVSLPGRAKEAP